ncbi:hypothetical protein [Candidatus Solirubrobacter pratensis]|uniref:hypothetical protein n=1 Tax=Candidatus Solirubrobacter pratensis TaxID=1298857 RepID=UPI00041B28F6|nr:hypothetical protein [Candidatus Solirubrobacter pratensis]
MTFKITYTANRPPREVDETHFEKSKAFAPVLTLAVGESTPPGRYVSAGYRKIERIS